MVSPQTRGHRSPNHEGVPQTSGIVEKKPVFHSPHTLSSQPSVNIPLTVEKKKKKDLKTALEIKQLSS